MQKRKIIYIAGPYTQGNTKQNVINHHIATDKLIKMGYAPYNPLLSHYQNDHNPHEYETWMEIDLAFVRISDGLLRLPGKSPGAEREIIEATQEHIPIFHSIAEMVKYFKEHNSWIEKFRRKYGEKD